MASSASGGSLDFTMQFGRRRVHRRAAIQIDRIVNLTDNPILGRNISNSPEPSFVCSTPASGPTPRQSLPPAARARGGALSILHPVFLAARHPESRTVGRAPAYQILWVRGFRDHTNLGRGFNLFKPLRRHFRATPFCRRGRADLGPMRQTPTLLRLRKNAARSPRWGSVPLSRDSWLGERMARPFRIASQSVAHGGPASPGRVGRPPSFFASISKFRPVLSKDFQRFFWRFCGISRGYSRCKPKKRPSQIFVFSPLQEPVASRQSRLDR
jgi:hypothetical protein